MKALLIVFIFLFLFGCKSKNENTINFGLPTLDLSKDYPEKKIDICEIADVEYIPLETKDESIVALGIYFKISEDYIITYDQYGPIHFFSRKGKHLYSINNYGSGPTEFTRIFHLAVDFEKEEYYVSDHTKIQVYSFTGDWKRTLKKPQNMKYDNLFNYNEKFLITNNTYDDRSHLEKSPVDKTPYYLIDKVTGVHTPLFLTVENRISKVFNERIVRFNKNTSMIDYDFIYMTPLLANNNDFLIADYGLDTLYSYKNCSLTPIAVQSPPVHSSHPPTVIVPVHYTDQFLTFKPFQMIPIPGKPDKNYEDAPTMMWNRKTDEIFRIELYDSNTNKTIHRMWHQHIEPNNCIVRRHRADALIDLYEAGELKGEIKDIASKMKFDDNPFIAIYKLK